jgi:hypothetical protein
MARVRLPALLLSLSLALGVVGTTVAVAGTSPPGASCPVFPADNVWNTDISQLPVNANSNAWLGSMNAGSTNLHPDFGSSGDPSAPYGIPYAVVTDAHPKVPVTFQFADESDKGPYPFGPETPIEGGANATGDRHAIMVDSTSCTLYELYDARYATTGSTAGSGAIWNLTSDALRPAGWTSADAAGLPIFAGLLRPDEVAAGVITHAIRFTAVHTDTSYIWPARHQAGARSDPTLPPMGARFRLKASVDTSSYSPATQAVLRAMQHYGLILADNGSNWFFQGSASNDWDPTTIAQLKTIPASAFEAVDESSLMVSPDSGAVATAPPKIALTRLAGADRDSTSVAASQHAFPARLSAKAAVIASDAGFADALSAAPLAKSAGGPLLLTSPSGLSPGVRAEISRVLPAGATVYVLGGDDAIAPVVEAQLSSSGYVPRRLAGADRFGTAVVVAQAIGSPSTIVEATGLDFPDGLSAGAAAAAIHRAILLTDGDVQAASTASYLQTHPGTRYAVGGPATRADPGATAVVGADRYATATAVAGRFFPAPSTAGFASGAAFPDALSGGASIAVEGAPLLLVPQSGPLPAAVSAYLQGRPAITTGLLYGGTAAVGADIAAEVAAA